MSIALTDIALKYVVEFTFKTLRDNPQHFDDIFGDYRLDPNAALLGSKAVNNIKQWFSTTKIPVVLGFNLAETEIPAVTVHIDSSSPVQQYLGDRAGSELIPQLPQDREVIIPKFVPKSLVFSADRTYITVTPPDDMSAEQQQLFLPGLRVRDAKGQEYNLTLGDDNLPIVTQFGDETLDALDGSTLEVISPYSDASFSRGAMRIQERIMIVIHGKNDRNEGLWLWAIVVWGLMKFRPLLISVFGLDLAVPSSTDFVKADEFIGDNVWRRYIYLDTYSIWSWQEAQNQDIIGLLLTIRAINKESEDPKL
jgi:hypothetical protein